MVNLLFISNSPKSESIVSNLQSKLKVRIDVVTDFDLGLKDVFEKRPATVLIQDQIAGVTGESVARHIQMLLGSGAPSFVMTHDGSGLMKPIKGLVEHLVDLTQPDAKIAADILGILKSIFGSEWDKIIVVPRSDAAEVAAPLAVTEEKSQDADSLICNVVTDPGQDEGGGGFSSQVLKTESPTDELARLLVESAQKDKQPKSPAPAVQSAQGDPSGTPAVPPKPPIPQTQTAILVPPLAHTSKPSPTFDAAASPIPPASSPEMGVRLKKAVESSHPAPTSADFTIAASANGRGGEIPDDLLLQFEKNFHAQAKKRRLYIVVMVLVVALAGAAWFLRQRPGNGSSAGSPGVRKPIAATVIPASGVSVPKVPAVVQTKPTSAQKTAAAPATQLPAFIGGATRDDSFAVGKPGWERYVGKTAEYRLFRSEGQIKAVQVLARPGQAISRAFMHNILTDVAGKSVYKIRSTVQKDGYLVQSAVVSDNNADLLLYLKKRSGKIRAFVISFN